ncbi:MAG: hypothetical protein RL344_259 [Pseudomonadota bacterium]|jgi:hypothetical protein
MNIYKYKYKIYKQTLLNHTNIVICPLFYYLLTYLLPIYLKINCLRLLLFVNLNVNKRYLVYIVIFIFIFILYFY